MKKSLLIFFLLLNFLIFSNNYLQSQTTAIAVSENNIFAGTNWGGIFLSTDNGTNWVAVNNGLTNLSIMCIATSGGNIFAGTPGGGIFLSTNNGASWTAVNNGIPNGIVQSIVISGVNVFAGTWGGGVFLSTDSGANWTAVNNGLTNLGVISLSIEGDRIFAGTRTNPPTEGKLFLSTNNGTSWTELANIVVLSIVVSGENIFAGTINGVFLSTDNGTTWNPVNNGLTSLFIRSLVINEENIFAGTSDGGIFLSTNNGANWTAVNNGLTHLNVQSFAINGENVFAATEGGIFLSTNNGSGWNKIFDDQYFLTANTGIVKLSIFSDGYIGSGSGYGEGFTFMNYSNALYAGGIAIGNNNNNAVGMVSSLFINDMLKSGIMPDFSSNENFNEISKSFFKDSDAPSPYGVEVKQYTYAKTNNPCIYYVYDVKNESASTINDFYIGMFADWDIGDYSINLGGYVHSDNLVYQYEFAGGQDPNFYGIVALSGMSGARVSTTGDRELIIEYMSTFLNDSITTMGDYRSFIGSGPFTIEPNSSQMVGFAILAGTDFNNLISNTQSAQQGWNSGIVGVDKDDYEITRDYILFQNYPNPFNPVTKIKYSIPSFTLRQAQSDIKVTLKVYDILGSEIATLVNEEKPAGEYEVEFNAANLPSGIYFYQLKAGSYSETRKMVLIK